MSVMDSVDKYRHGVLIGNFVQDKFGRDLHQKGPIEDVLKITSMKAQHNTQHSLYQKNPVIDRAQKSYASFYQTSRSIDPAYYQKPENQTTYAIFHTQEPVQQVPILRNDPKRQEKLARQGNLYADTRYHLANKFGTLPGVQNSIKNQSVVPGVDKDSFRETGNIYDIEGQQIPDILTGEIYRHGYKKPDNEVHLPSKDRNAATTKVFTGASTQSINPFGATKIVKPQVQKFDQEQYMRYVVPNDKGEGRDILFGHGIELDQFQRRQLATSYDLSYNQLVKPQEQINSFYNPDQTLSAKKFHKAQPFQKSYQQKIPDYGTKTLLGQEKLGRPYAPYTKSYDLNHLKNEYLRK